MNNDLHIERIWLANNLRNYNYIAVCKKTAQAMVVDPFAVDQIMSAVRQNNWQVTKVVNTHDHGDHIAGNEAIVEQTGAPLFAPTGAAINHVDHWINEGDTINLGESIVFDVIDTSGHTLPHISLLSNTQQPELLCGDTIFNAGAGNVHSGDASVLYRSFETKLQRLSDDTRIYPGHDYMQTNLEFTLQIDPTNQAAKTMLEQAKHHQPEDQIITTIGQEKTFNTFMRLDDPDLVANLKLNHPELGNNPSRENVFLKLRELRNNW